MHSDFRNEPDNRVQTIVANDPHLLTPEERQLQRLGKLSNEIKRLYAWLGLVTGLSVLSLGLLTGFTMSLQRQNNNMQEKLSAIDAYKAQADQVKNLEARLQGLEGQALTMNQSLVAINNQVPKDLSRQIKGFQSDITALRNAIQSDRANFVSRAQLEQRIQVATQQQNRRLESLPPR